MNFTDYFLTGVGLSMDALAVALCIGLTLPKVNFKNALIVGIYFGSFQALMPLIGFFLGSQFADKIEKFDHWIALILLFFIGGKLIYECFSKEKTDTEKSADLGLRVMLPLALATSIDALAVGVSFSFLKVNIYGAVLCIGITTLLFSALGVFAGKKFGLKFKKKAEFAGGIILILIGLKIVLEHTEFFSHW